MKQKLIDAIDWNKEWEELSVDEKANFLSLHDVPYLNKSNEEDIKSEFLEDRDIVHERGKDNLHLYIILTPNHGKV